MIRTDFEKFFKHLTTQQKTLDFEVFGSYAVSVLNFYVTSGCLDLKEKQSGCQYLIQLFNAGLGNRISPEDQLEIATVILNDPTLDYSVIGPVFN